MPLAFRISCRTKTAVLEIISCHFRAIPKHFSFPVAFLSKCGQFCLHLFCTKKPCCKHVSCTKVINNHHVLYLFMSSFDIGLPCDAAKRWVKFWSKCGPPSWPPPRGPRTSRGPCGWRHRGRWPGSKAMARAGRSRRNATEKMLKHVETCCVFHGVCVFFRKIYIYIYRYVSKSWSGIWGLDAGIWGLQSWATNRDVFVPGLAH